MTARWAPVCLRDSGGADASRGPLVASRRGPSSVDKPGRPCVVTGGDEVKGVVCVSGSFQAIAIDDDGAGDVAVKVLDSGVVVAAWAGGAPLGLWVSRS